MKPATRLLLSFVPLLNVAMAANQQTLKLKICANNAGSSAHSNKLLLARTDAEFPMKI